MDALRIAAWMVRTPNYFDADVDGDGDDDGGGDVDGDLRGGILRCDAMRQSWLGCRDDSLCTRL